MPGKDTMPSTIRRSPKKAQRTWVEVHDNAAKQYGDGQRAHRTAYAALKNEFEKVGDHWERKSHRGPSDPRSKQKSTTAKQKGRGATYGGVDVEQNTKKDLYERAKKLDVHGRSRMSKTELAKAVSRKQG